MLLDHLDHADVLDGGDQRARHRGDELVVAVGEGHFVHLAREVHHPDQDVLVDQRHAQQGFGFFVIAADIGTVATGIGHEQGFLRRRRATDHPFAHDEGDRRRRAVHLLGRQEGLGFQLVVLVEQVHRAALDAHLLVHGVQHQLQRGVLVARSGQGAADAVELGQVDHLLADRQAHGVEILRGQGQQDDQDGDGAFEAEADAVAQLGLQTVELRIGGHQHLVQAVDGFLHRDLGGVQLLPGGLRLGQLFALVIDQAGFGLEPLAQCFNTGVGGIQNALAVHRLEQRHDLVEPEHRAVDDELEVVLGAVQALQLVTALQFLGGFGDPGHQRIRLVGEALGQGQILFQSLARRAGVDDIHKRVADIVGQVHDLGDLVLDLLLGHQHRQLGVEHPPHRLGVGLVVALDLGDQGLALRVRLGQAFEALVTLGELLGALVETVAVGADVFFAEGVEAQGAEVGQLQQLDLYLVDFGHHRYRDFLNALIGAADIAEIP